MGSRMRTNQKLTAEEEQALIDFEEKLLDPENAECYDRDTTGVTIVIGFSSILPS